MGLELPTGMKNIAMLRKYAIHNESTNRTRKFSDKKDQDQFVFLSEFGVERF